MGERTANVVPGDLGQTVNKLSGIIAGRRSASPEESYTKRLLDGPEDKPLKKLVEEACEVALACKDNDHDHIRYECGDVVYHLLVVCERWGITPEELAGELNARMKD
jgi:phosphoribosyl-ATP pyrophosphohydrolase